MNLLVRSISGANGSLLRALGRRYYAAVTEEYAKRNYANNVSEYNTVITSITSKRRHYLLRDVYEDMVLDGVQPTRETFQALLVGSMRGARLQDAFFFRDEMEATGLVPDVALFNFLISACGKCKNSDQAILILEEMKTYEVKPNGQTYVCLLNACAAAGRLDRVLAIVRDMTAAGAALDRFCYAGLITANLNKTPKTVDVAEKIVELAQQSKGWSSVEASNASASNVMLGVYEEELYNLPTADYIHRRGGFLARNLTVYHVAFNACAVLRNVEAMETLLEMLKGEGKTPDVYIITQIMRCYLHSGDTDKGLKTFEDHMNAGKLPAIELYLTLTEGAMVGYTPKGMKIAEETLLNMNSRNFFLTPKMGSDLLLIAAGEKTGGYTCANLIWDLMQTRNLVPTLPAVAAYYNGLKSAKTFDAEVIRPKLLLVKQKGGEDLQEWEKFLDEREIPADDPRLSLVSRTYDNLRVRFGTPS